MGIEYYLSIRELSHGLRISYANASSLAIDPCFPKIIIGNRKVFPKVHVSDWIKSHQLKKLL